MALRYLSLLAFLSIGMSFAQANQSQLQLMQKEKMRILALRRQLIQKHASPLEIFKTLNYSIAQGNEKQYANNVGLVKKLQEYATIADKKRLPKKRDEYLKLAGIYKYYAEQNVRVVKAYRKLDSGEFEKGLAEIKKIENKITEMGFKPAKRNWFTFEELEKVPLPGQEPKKDAETGGTKNS